jgi:uncharacterized protein
MAFSTSCLPEERFEAIDALRGFALAGVFLSNLAALSLFGMLPADTRAALPTAAFDTLAMQAIDLLIGGKFITIFSLLFGLGFAMQLKRAEARASGGLARYVRRLLVLLGIGAAHSYFVWWGDILLVYAVAGLALILFRGLSDRMLLGLGLTIALVLPLLAAPWIDSVFPSASPQEELYAWALQAFSAEDPFAALHANAALANWARIGNWPLACFVLGRFLLGYWAGRAELLQRPDQHLPSIRRIFAWSLGIGVALTLAYRNDAARLLMENADSGAGMDFTDVIDKSTALALGIAYATGFALLYRHLAWQRWLRLLAPVGRMALTHYLAQSVICVVLFYGVGLGVGPEWGVAAWLIVWAAFFALQIVLSHVWLARYRYGPMEWLWRWLTDGARPALRRYALEPTV